MKLEKHEILYIWRKREKITQTQAARVLRVTQQYYSDVETGHAPFNYVWSYLLHLTNIKPWELAVLQRRRLGLTIKDMTSITALRRNLIMRIEAGGASKFAPTYYDKMKELQC